MKRELKNADYLKSVGLRQMTLSQMISCNRNQHRWLYIFKEGYSPDIKGDTYIIEQDKTVLAMYFRNTSDVKYYLKWIREVNHNDYTLAMNYIEQLTEMPWLKVFNVIKLLRGVKEIPNHYQLHGEKGNRTARPVV